MSFNIFKDILIQKLFGSWINIDFIKWSVADKNSINKKNEDFGFWEQTLKNAKWPRDGFPEPGVWRRAAHLENPFMAIPGHPAAPQSNIIPETNPNSKSMQAM